MASLPSLRSRDDHLRQSGRRSWPIERPDMLGAGRPGEVMARGGERRGQGPRRLPSPDLVESKVTEGMAGAGAGDRGDLPAGRRSRSTDPHPKPRQDDLSLTQPLQL